MFRPEDTIYEMDQTCSYKYNYDAFVEFYDQLHYGRHSILDMYNLALIDRVVHIWRVDKDKRDCPAKSCSKVGQPYSVYFSVVKYNIWYPDPMLPTSISNLASFSIHL